MTTTARHHIGRIAATADPDLIEAVIYSGLLVCNLCGLAADLYTRIDGRDGEEIEVCEHCAEHGDVTPLPDCD